ncbi:MAG: hypothetical protein AMXMBFR13_20220 [Phycisphaerae bacterium]
MAIRLDSWNRPLARSTPRTGFTLIEVLVVVAIIALLVAILMPSLARARAMARNTQDLSNLRQIGTAMQTYALANKELIPRGIELSTDNVVCWISAVAKELGYIKRIPAQLNELRVEQMPVFHCPERMNTLPHPYIDYVINSMTTEWLTYGYWLHPQAEEGGDHTKIGTYKRPSEVIYVADAELEDKNTPLGSAIALQMSREGWKGGVDSGSPASTGLEAMDVWMGAHLPEGKLTFNLSDAKGPRRAARKMHLGRFTNANFFDGHGASLQLRNDADPVINYAHWLKLFGVKEPLRVAKEDSTLR